jgi:hypothetical protein
MVLLLEESGDADRNGAMTVAVGEEKNSCERCGRPVGLESLWSLAVTLPADGRIERDICVVCAAELRHHLLRDARQLERASAPPPGVRTDAAATDVSARPFDRRAAGLLLRGALYLCVGLAFFLLVTWLLSR